MLQIAPSGHWRHAAHQRNSQPRCPRAQRHDTLVPHIARVWFANIRVCGADKVWEQMNREGFAIARCAFERLMQRLGLQGVRRSKVVRSTLSDMTAPRIRKLIGRIAQAPLHQSTHEGMIGGVVQAVTPSVVRASVLYLS